ncbi:hypothetical protein [Aquimarina sp. AU119]|uniref:hypothetical protein n=1 Tax=Aquimarina sp. AU119 TaxID=2108528 RepID=UPI000D68A9BD|nr:hypothetical protein [Aquimarina sp. AU119]
MCAQTIQRICTPITPPGTIINPENPKIKATPLLCGNEKFTFSLGSPSREQLPPLIKAVYTNTGGVAIEAMVFIDSSIPVTNFSVYQNYTTCSTGAPQLTLYICPFLADGNPPANPETDSYNLYPLNLGLKIQTPNGQLIRSIQIFLWNEDPETSRGTVTTVPPPTE